MIFGNIGKEFEGVRKTISELVKDINTITSFADISGTYKKFNINLKNLSVQDVEALQKYVDLLSQGVNKKEAFNSALSNVSDGVKEQAINFTLLNQAYKKGQISEEAYISATQNLITVQKAATVSSKALNIGLNLLANVGFVIAMSAITKFIQAEQEAVQKQADLRDSYVETAQKYKEESEAIDDLINQYNNIISSSDDFAAVEKELSKLQDELIDKYGEKAEKLDLVNRKYADAIDSIRQFKLEEAKEYVSKADLNKSYEQAKERLKTVSSVEYQSGGHIETGDATTVLRKAFGFDSKMLEAYRQAIEDVNNANASYRKNSLGDVSTFYIGGTLDEQVKTLKKIAELYGNQKGYNEDTLALINEQIEAKEKEIEQYQKIISEYETAKKVIEELDIPNDVKNQFTTLINQANELRQQLESGASPARQYEILQELDGLREELNQLAGDNAGLREIIGDTFSFFDSSISNSIQSVGDLREAWFKSLDDMQKGSLKNIDTMKSALQSIMNGENISSDTFWQLAEFDTDHILNGVKMVGDEFQLTEEQIISLKDTYIKKQMESIQLRQTELKQLKSAEEMEARQLQVALDNWKFADKNLNNPKYRAEFEDLQNRLKTAKENAAAYGDEWNLNAILLRQYNADLGNTADLIQAAQSQAEKLSEAFVGRIDKVIDGINDQKDALTEEKEVLQDQLDVLEAQADEIKGIIEDYEKVADIVKETIEEEISTIEETYNKQIEALKAQNEEREEAINLTEKLNNLNNAKNNKVVTYTEAGGFQYGVNKEAVNKAQQEYDKALIDSQIAKLEKERDSATAGFEEYAKLWENATKKATKAEEEELAARILGADWREKISEQDVEIFETYEQKYDEYGVSLNNITNIEIANVKKSIEAKDKEIKAKEDLLKEWQKYKINVQSYVNDLKNTNKEYEDSIENITLTENSNLDERLANFKRFKGEYESMINRILELQNGVGDIEVNASVNMDDFTDGIKEVVEGIGTVSEKLAETIKELGKMPSINSAGDVKYYQATGYQHYASGGVNSSTGLAWLDGTRRKPEVVLNNQDATKLYNLLHSMPASAAQMFSSPLTRFAGLKSGSTSQSSAITITGNTINLPNVRDPQQFAREMERYLQTTLTESQIIPLRS